jgi:hypothetical protein
MNHDIQEHIRRARLQRSLYIGEAIERGITAIARLVAQIVAPRPSTKRQLAPR